ncbi:hypothetical protein FRC17_001688 [Serendipita sp. 399]|nr:hypothetical protein FRC17_001688 [Serendipita sp. 399]
MEDAAGSIVAEPTMPIGVPMAGQDTKAKKRRATESQVTAFQPATPFPDLLDPRALLEPLQSSGSSSSDPNSGSSDPSTGDDSSPSPSSFLGTPYSTSLQFDYPFPISNAPRDPVLPPSQPPSALPIASSLASAPSLITAAASSITPETPDTAASNPLPSMVSTIAASMDIPVNNTLLELRHMSNKSTSSLGSTHSGHTQTSVAHTAHVASSAASTHSISPSSSFQTGSHVSQPPPRPKGRHSLIISPLPPPPLALQNHAANASGSPTAARRPKLQSVSSVGSTGSDTSQESLPVSHNRSRPPSGSLSSLSIASLQLLSNPGEPPIPPSLLNKLNRPRHTSTNSNATSYFSSNTGLQRPPNSRDFFGSPTYDTSAASLPPTPPTNLSTDSSSDFYKPTTAPPNRTGFSVFRPHLGRSNSTNTGNSSYGNRPFFSRSNTTNSQLQSRAYAQHLRHQQEQQLKQEEQRKEKEQKKKAEKEKEKKKPSKIRRSSLSLSRSPSGSSASSARTKASSSTKSKSPSSSNSQTDGFKLSPTQSSLVESAIDESEGSASPEGTKIRRRSSVRRILEKTGSLVGFNLSLNARLGGNTSPKDGKRSPKRSGDSSPKERGNVSPKRSGKESPNVRNTD